MRLDASTLQKYLQLPIAGICLYAAAGAASTLLLLSGRGPIAIAFLAVCRRREHMLAALSGSVLMTLLAMDFTAGLRHCAILVLIYAVHAAFRDTKYIEKELFRPLSAAGMTAAVEFAYLLEAGLSGERLAGYLTYVATVGMLSHYLQLLTARQRRSAESSVLPSLRRRLALSAAAFRDLYSSFGRPAPPKNDENPAVVFDRAAEAVCRGCGSCARCWGREYISTFNALNDATPAMLRRGRSLPEDYPDHFRKQCENLTGFLAAVDRELTALLLRRQYSRRLEAERRRAREGEQACGDTVTHFVTEQGVLYLLLSDGMGSGQAARRESLNATRLLEQFLRAGVEPEPALRTINGALALHNEEAGTFTTIDLLALHLRTRQAALYKYGAAPTYIKRNGNVRRLTGSALPAGLQEAGTLPAPIRFQVEPGTFLLMASDGVAGEGGDEWLQNTLAGWQGEEPQRLVSLLMGESRTRGGLRDDCSMLCLYWTSGGKAV